MNHTNFVQVDTIELGMSAQQHFKNTNEIYKKSLNCI